MASSIDDVRSRERESRMKIANLKGRAVIVTDRGALDVAQSSSGRFGPDLQTLYDDWAAFRNFAATANQDHATEFDLAELHSPVPRPRQVFAIGLNYQSHAEETGMEAPLIPAVFTKFPSSLAGPFDPIRLSGDRVDWEVELVVVLGSLAEHVDEAGAWDHVAGLAIGQDISDRTVQMAAARQFSLGKSFRGYGPIGPWLVTIDELDDPGDLAIGCAVNGETVQSDRTSSLIFKVPSLIAQLSAVLPLWPGDVIFTGTPAGVGMSRSPERFLADGDRLESWIEGIGRIASNIEAPLR
jgi:2-keto-4-pentenoate hydratase/2-oxohepta-3-ene-1,7-dioic acid hydratase in catechol pathway